MNPPDFSSLNLPPDLLNNLATLGYTAMTPIQAQSLPPMLAGQDVIGQARTGSGKTAAFGLSLLAHLDVAAFRVQALVLCPTRELADQVAGEIRRLARGTHNVKVLALCGGAPVGPQIGSLEHGAHIIVGTPGRVEEHLRKGRLHLQALTTLVLDEADRMLEMGFQPALDAILAEVPSPRQTLLFSATFPQEIQDISARIMVDPLLVKADSSHDAGSIEQHFYKVTERSERLTAVRLLLAHFQPASTLVFCNTKRETQALADALSVHGVSALALHGDLAQRERDQTLIRFSNGSVAVLVATDVAARGLDIDNLDAVINFDVAHDARTHLHRIGRTGRSGRRGIACSLYSPSEAHRVAVVEADVDPIIDAEPLPPASLLDTLPPAPPMVTLQIDGGRKQKLRPGDILGALTGEDGIAGSQVGKINLQDTRAYVAVSRNVVEPALRKLANGKLKGRTFKVRRLGGTEQRTRRARAW